MNVGFTISDIHLFITTDMTNVAENDIINVL